MLLCGIMGAARVLGGMALDAEAALAVPA